MIRSMTGVGRAEAVLRPGNSRITVDIRSVNHKFLELIPSLPSELADYESEIRELVRRRVRRGYVQVRVNLEEMTEGPRLVVDHRLVRDYVRLARELQKRYRIGGELNINTLLSQPGVVACQRPQASRAQLWRVCRRVIVQALSQLVRMKQTEGAALARDLRRRIHRIRQALKEIERRVPKRLQERRDNLVAQLKELNVEANPRRVLEEVAFITERLDIHEECVRLKSHCSMFLRALTRVSSGKKLDFIAQEMLRETDTLAAKARDLVISRRAIEIKGEIERLKEQVRNVE
ncbi:MAG: YicC/YloC family endoribonuclease [candidate division WOR-3 bacterium]